MRNFLSFIALVANVICGLSKRTSKYESGQTIVRTSTGTYTGLIEPQFPETLQFRSIAFAQPPVGSRRWLPPQRLPQSSKWHSSVDYPPSCPQFISSVPSLLSEYFAEGALISNGNQNHTSGLVGASTSEDCLYLAIWTPANATLNSKLPVLFFMTGGGFTSGGVSIPYQHPTDWVQRSQSHIVVTINYRLNVFGFPNARALKDQNLGLLDQRLALEWVRDNIASFGGNPGRITQWGQSAGSISADAHAYAFYKDPIASGYFMQSGTIFSGTGVVDLTCSNFSFVAREFGCNFPSDNDGVKEIDCMRKIPFTQIENFIGQYGDRGELPVLSFIPVADERTVFSDYTARIRAGQVARVPAIMSTTANEASSLVPFPKDNPVIPIVPQSVIDSVTVSMFVCAAYSSVLARNQLDIPIFRYQHAGTYPNLNPLDWVGAYHGSDLPLLFGTYGLVKTSGNVTKFESEVSRAIQDHVIAFAKDPYSGPQLIGWEPFVTNEPEMGQVARFGAKGRVIQHVNGVELDGICLGTGSYDAFP